MSTKATVIVSTDVSKAVTVGALRHFLEEVDKLHLSDNLVVKTSDGRMYVSFESTNVYSIECWNHSSDDAFHDVLVGAHECG